MQINLSIIIILCLFLSCQRVKLTDRYPEIPNKKKIISLKKFEKDNDVMSEREAPKCSKLFYNTYKIDIDFYKKDQESIRFHSDNIGLDSLKLAEYSNIELDSVKLVEYLTKENRVIVYKQNEEYMTKIIDSTLKKHYFKEKNVDFEISNFTEIKTTNNQCISVMQISAFDDTETQYNFYVGFLNGKISDTQLVEIYKKKSTNYVRSYCRLRKKGIFIHTTYLKDCEFSRKAPIYMETNLCYWRYSEVWQVNNEGKFILLGYTDKRYF